MYQTSDDYKNKVMSGLYDENDEILDITINFVTLNENGEEEYKTYHTTEINVVKDSLSVSSQIAENGGLTAGSVRPSELSLTIADDNLRDVFKEAVRGVISILYGLKVGNTAYETIPFPEFVIDFQESYRKGNIVYLKSYDFLIKFEKDYEPVFDYAPPVNSYYDIYDFLWYIHLVFDVDLAQTKEQIEALPNSSMALSPAYDKIATFRDLLMHICVITGTFARMNRLNRLELVQIKPFLNPDGIPVSQRIIPAKLRSDTEFSDKHVRTQGIIFKYNGKIYKRATQSNIIEPIIMSLPENPLIPPDVSINYISAMTYNILVVLYQLGYSPCSFDFFGDPSFDCGDFIAIRGGNIDNDDSLIFLYITEQYWKFQGTHYIKSSGVTNSGGSSQSYKSYSENSGGGGGGDGGINVFLIDPEQVNLLSTYAETGGTTQIDVSAYDTVAAEEYSNDRYSSPGQPYFSSANYGSYVPSDANGGLKNTFLMYSIIADSVRIVMCNMDFLGIRDASTGSANIYYTKLVEFAEQIAEAAALPDSVTFTDLRIYNGDFHYVGKIELVYVNYNPITNIYYYKTDLINPYGTLITSINVESYAVRPYLFFRGRSNYFYALMQETNLGLGKCVYGEIYPCVLKGELYDQNAQTGKLMIAPWNIYWSMIAMAVTEDEWDLIAGKDGIVKGQFWQVTETNTPLP